jgi:small-conductance mechanosensitive channel/CRP-like cAMP-binding protein
MMGGHWLKAAAVGGGTLLVLEMLYFLLRKRVPRFRLNLLYHLWALSLALLAALRAVGIELLASTIGGVASTVALLLTVVVVYALVDALILQQPWGKDQGPLVPKLARDVLRLGLLIAVGLFAATEILDQPVGAVLVSSTVLSAVVGLALQDTLKNVFSGMALDLEKPFRPGDWMVIEGGVRAQVVDMSWRSTHLRSKEGLDIYEPNANLSVSRLVNYGSGEQPFAVQIRIGLPYGVPPAEIKEVLREAALSAPGALDRPAVRVLLESFGDHAITYFIRVWTRRVSNVSGFVDDVNSRIWYQLKRHGIEIPFPIRTIHMHEAPDMEQQRRDKALSKAFELFSRVDIFHELDGQIVRQLAASSQRKLYDAGEVLVREGEQGDSLFVVEKGAVRVTKSDPEAEGKHVDLAILEQGAFFGEMSLLTGEPRSATIIARDPCGVLVLTKPALAATLESDPRIAESLSRALAARRLDTMETLEDRRGRRASDIAVEDEHTFLHRIRSFFSLS